MTTPLSSARLGAALLMGLAAAACGSSEFQTEEPQLLAVSGSFAGGDPVQAQIDLGRKLFFDENLSKPAGVSCGMCHNPMRGWGDGRPQGKGVQDHTLAGDVTGDGIPDHEGSLAVPGNRFKTILTPRNTPTIYNAHLFPSLFWDGRAADLIHQAVFPLEEGFEMNSSWENLALPLMNSDPEYQALLIAAYGDGTATKERAGQAMGLYEQTISVFDAPYDDFLAGGTNELKGPALAGHDLFFGKAGCAQCHPAPLLTDFQFHNTGVPSAGKFAVEGQIDLGAGKKTDLTQVPPVAIDNPAEYGKFKTPQLRMVGVTGPYMHNGVFDSLEEVVDFYDQGGGPDLSGQGTKSPLLQPLGLTAQEKAQLVAFLRNGLLGTEIR
jgi:cytochrome c peroxidase